MRSRFPGAASPGRIRPNEPPSPADMLTQVGVLLAIMLALALVAQILVGAPS
jgi:hypothetical protein